MKNCVELIINWYKNNKRCLPWRDGCNPYYVWISEVMLQQTRIESVIPYYNRFIHKIPNIKALSLIDEDDLLKLWEGLGYYSRARNLKKAACIIMERFNGVFPSNYEDILSLPGIGEYTAGAIASICFSLKEVCIDGNVMRAGILLLLAHGAVALFVILSRRYYDLSFKLFMSLIGVLVCLLLIMDIIFFVAVNHRDKPLKAAVTVLAVILLGVSGAGSYYVHKINKSVDNLIDNDTEEQYETINGAFVTYDDPSITSL